MRSSPGAPWPSEHPETWLPVVHAQQPPVSLSRATARGGPVRACPSTQGYLVVKHQFSPPYLRSRRLDFHRVSTASCVLLNSRAYANTLVSHKGQRWWNHCLKGNKSECKWKDTMVWKAGTAWKGISSSQATRKKPRTATAVTTKRKKTLQDWGHPSGWCDLRPAAAPRVGRWAEQGQPPLQVGRTPTKPPGTELEVTFQTPAYFGRMLPTPKVHACCSETPKERMTAAKEGDSSKDGGAPRGGPGTADSGSSFWLPTDWLPHPNRNTLLRPNRLGSLQFS